MAEDLKTLIARIQEEGVAAAEEKAAAIERAAQSEAAEVVAAARREAAGIIEEARREADRRTASGTASLKQAGRDLVLSLRGEIAAMLDRVIAGHVTQALAPDEMARLIRDIIKDAARGNGEAAVVTVKKDAYEKVERALLEELGELAAHKIVLRCSDDIRNGFTISYDGGRSRYEFTDEALVAYLGTLVKPKLADILAASL